MFGQRLLRPAARFAKLAQRGAKTADDLVHWIRQLALATHRLMLRARLCNVGTGRHAVRDPDIAANAGPTPNRDPPEHRGTGVNHHVVFHDRVARLPLDGFA